MTAKKNEVAEHKHAAPPVAAEPVNLNDWGVPELSAKDIMIPKIYVMQPMSKLVTAGVAKFGEFVESLNKRVIADTTKPLEIIPFYRTVDYVVQKEVKGKFEFDRVVPITKENDDEEFEQVAVDGTKEKWYRTSNFYCLLPADIASGEAIPHVLSFRSTSAKAGSKIATTMYVKNINAGRVPAAMAIEVSGEKTTNDKGTFIVVDARDKRLSTQVEIAECFKWLQLIKSGVAKVDHSDLAEEATEAAQTGTPHAGNY